MTKIRVMRIIARMNVGGPAVQVSGLLRGLDNSLFDHRLFTGRCDESEADFLENVATDLSAITIPGLGRSIHFWDDAKAFVQLIREIRSFRPHIIHTHTAKAGVLGRLASIFSGVNSVRVHTYHGHLLNGYFGKFKTFLVIVIERLLSTFTHQLLAVGTKVQDDLIRAGIGDRDKFQVMPPGLTINDLPSRTDALNSLGITSGEEIICAFIGRITQIKRPDRFLDVVAELKRRNSNVSFILAGDGDLLEECRERIKTESLPVLALGWCLNIETVLAAADVVLLTSDNEGTPLSLIQAGMAGLPVVSTNVGSVSEIIIANRTGILTPLESVQIANSLELFINSHDLRKQLGNAAKDFTFANFGTARLVSDHKNLYAKLFSNQANF